MGTVSERLAFLITANADGAIKAFEATGRAADKELGRAEGKIDKVGVQMSRFGAGALAATGVAAVGLFKLADSAGDAAEATSKANVVFGDGAAKVLKYAENAAKSAGLSETAALGAASTFGTMGKAAGLAGDDLGLFSTDMVALSADLASFSNTSPEQAIEAIGAALRGESEPIRAYGVLLDDATLKQRAMELGLYNGTGALTQQAKVLAAQAEIIAQTSDAQGDFARTSDGLANQQKILAAEFENLKISIGEGVLPVATTLISTLNGVAGAVGDLDPAVQSGVGSFLAYGTAALGIVGSLSFAGGQAIKFRDNLTTVGDDGARSLNKLGKAGAVAGAGLAALATIEIANSAFDAFNDTAAKTERTLNQLTATALDNSASNEQLIESIGKAAEGSKSLTDNLLDVTDAIGITSNKFDDMDIRLGDVVVSAGELERALDNIDNPEVLQRTLDALKELLGTLDEDSQQYRQLSDQIARAEANLNAQTAAQAALAKQSEETAAGLDGVGNSADEAAGKVQTLEERFANYYGLIDGSNALLDAQDQFADLTESMKEAADTSGKSAEEIAQDQRDVQRATNSTKEEVIDYAAKVGGIPDEALTNILALIDQGKIQEAYAEFDRLTKTRQALIEIVTSGGRGGPAPKYRAQGGPVKAGEGYVVGEAGREYFQPDRDGFVYPASKMKDDPKGGGAVTNKVLNIGAITIVGDTDQKLNEITAWYQGWTR